MRAAPLKCQVQCGETRIYTNLAQKQTRAEWNESLERVQALLSFAVQVDDVIKAARRLF